MAFGLAGPSRGLRTFTRPTGSRSARFRSSTRHVPWRSAPLGPSRGLRTLLDREGLGSARHVPWRSAPGGGRAAGCERYSTDRVAPLAFARSTRHVPWRSAPGDTADPFGKAQAAYPAWPVIVRKPYQTPSTMQTAEMPMAMTLPSEELTRSPSTFLSLDSTSRNPRTIGSTSALNAST